MGRSVPYDVYSSANIREIRRMIEYWTYLYMNTICPTARDAIRLRLKQLKELLSRLIGDGPCSVVTTCARMHAYQYVTEPLTVIATRPIRASFSLRLAIR